MDKKINNTDINDIETFENTIVEKYTSDEKQYSEDKTVKNEEEKSKLLKKDQNKTNIKKKENENKMDTQIIGLDIGRGYVKGYSLYNEKEYTCLFKSIYGDGRNISLDDYKENPIYVEIDGAEYFVGDLSEKESMKSIRNAGDSKTSSVVRILISAALSEIAVSDNVSLIIGVPYKIFKKSTLKEIQREYKDSTVSVKNKINNSVKTIKIENVNIFREADAALIYAMGSKINEHKPVGMVNIGFRTTELSYFDKGFKFNDKLSTTIESGNQNALKMVQKRLVENGITKSLPEIDSADDYPELKELAYKLTSDDTNEIIEETWNNLDEMDIYVSGGTALNLSLDDRYIKVEDSQMATAKGLYEVGVKLEK
ncbi:ParM/StbA family protein [Peptostreptococcus equinus]|uniref:ParM/StbA family protein n=1 Tax=Peptostreptococcus equinus TaxID=3003601 RepID=A0ABY7JSC4_9FIRM|nr:ParM/StbA family protein [Peptostreptococcus sp. CBA3647]WAW14837.1 ParM/StbA family protein [Peptostreptococcus sp. CBA3647]